MRLGADLDRRVTAIRDRLSYVLIYAPEFPAEDATTVEAEFDELLAQVQTLWNELQDVERRRWLDLLGGELVEARAAFLGGDTKRGCSLIQSAEERLASWRSRKEMKPSFIVGPAGDAKRADDED
jgi:hypothetical protein